MVATLPVDVHGHHQRAALWQTLHAPPDRVLHLLERADQVFRPLDLELLTTHAGHLKHKPPLHERTMRRAPSSRAASNSLRSGSLAGMSSAARNVSTSKNPTDTPSPMP